jgi:hypothetical protein
MKRKILMSAAAGWKYRKEHFQDCLVGRTREGISPVKTFNTQPKAL